MESDLGNLTDKELEALRSSFFTQAYEILEHLSEDILRLEKHPDDIDVLKNIQRYVHTLKGDSASMGFSALSDISHRLEDVLHMLREKRLFMDRGIGDLMLSFVDISSQILTNSKEGSQNGVDTGDLIDKINKCLSSESAHKPDDSEKRGGGRQHLTEYQQLQAETAVKNGFSVYEIKITFDDQCKERGIGAFMINSRLSVVGEVICWMPDIEDEGVEKADEIKAIFCTHTGKDIIEKNIWIAGICSKVDAAPFSLAISPSLSYSPSGEEEKAASSFSEEDAKNSAIISGGRDNSDSLHHSEETVRAKGNKIDAAHYDTVLRVDAKRIDEIMDLVGELIIGRSMLTQSVNELKEKLGKDEIITKLENVNSLFERSLTELQNDVMTARMVPIDHVLRKFPRIVRDLSLKKKKEVKIEIEGADTELDKGIVDVIGEPLMHILRNSIDHGIELPEEREKKGKERCGVIKINAYHEGGQIVVEIEDDGRGINIEKLKQKAVKMEILKEEDSAKMPEEEALNLLFHSGLSTADEVTDTSGRGIGMDAVKRTVEELKGLVQVRSLKDMGSKFIIRLPLTLAIIQGMVFKAGEKFFTFPLSSILEIRRIFKDEISTINGMETLKWRERIISLIRLREAINQNTTEDRLLRSARNDKEYDRQDSHCEEQSDEAISNNKNKSFVLVIGIAERRLGIMVDKLIGKRELVIKAMDNGSDMASGASILGDGSIVLVLDVASLIKRAMMPTAGTVA